MLLDLFSGIGGFSLAFERAGLRTVAFSEIDPFPCRVLAHHWPEVPNLGDVRIVNGADVVRRFGPISVVSGGFPCQDISIAGRRKGIDGLRSGLFFQIKRIVEEMRDHGSPPTWVVLENTPGLFSLNRGRDFIRVLAGLRDCGAHSVGWTVEDAQFYGVAQRRRRVFIAACLAEGHSGADCGAEVFSLVNRLSGNTAACGEAGQTVARPLGSCPAGGSGYRNDADTADNLVAHSLRADGFDASEDGTGRGTPLVAATITAKAANHTGGPAGNVAAPITASFAKHHGSAAGKESVPHNLIAVAGNIGVRRLTPREAERLQGYSDDWTAIPGAKDSPRYRALGNSVAVPCVEWIARRIAATLAANRRAA